MIWRAMGILALLAVFAAVTWFGALHSYNTGGDDVAMTALVVIPLYLAIGGGIAAVVLVRRAPHDF